MKHKIILISAAVLLLASCEQMDYNEYNIYDKDYIASNFSNVGGFMTDIYKAVPYDFGTYSGAMLASATDESEYSKMGNAIEDFYNGAWSPSNAKGSLWTNLYAGIATCNTVLTEMQGLTFDELVLNDDYKQQMYRYENYQYESRFMRAYFYFLLARQYGGVPMVGETMTPEEINVLSRSSSDEVFSYVISECEAIQDKIIADYADLGDMALSSSETGRADRLAVLSLKAQAALYMASPLFNPSGDTERWHTAALYYKELLEACEQRGKGLAANYQDLWDTNNYTTTGITKEILLARRYYSSASGDHLVEGYNYPVGIEGGAGGNCPTQNLVDAYDMLNGKAIGEEGSGYDESNPYKDRDPRFALTVAYNGAQWPTYSGAPLLQTYIGGANAQPISGGTTTGYYLRKLCHGEISLASNGRVQNNFHTYVLYRLGAAYLDYAEAVFKYLGSADATSSEFPMSARELASKTRVRVGMPEIEAGLSNDAFWTKYQNERMVELAFEGYRFWDVRRWKEADKYFKSITQMNISKNDDGTFSYARKIVSRQWDDKMYFFPIPQTEVMKNGNLKQNTGWD